MKITTTHTRVMAALQLEADLTAEQIAKRTRLSQRVAQYNSRRLLELGILRPFFLVNPHALGLTDYCLFLKPIGHHDSLIKRARAVFQSSPYVAFAAQLIGEFLFSISCFGRDIRVVEQIMSDLRRALPRVSWDTRFAIRLEWTLFERQYLGSAHSQRSLTRTIDVPLQERTPKELRLLALLTEKPHEPLSRVALAAGLPESTGRALERSMRESGLILGKPCHFHAQALKRGAYRIVISVHSRSPEVDKLFREYGLHKAEISAFVICIGSWDYEYNLELLDPVDLGQYVSDLYDTFRDHIRELQTMSDAALVKLHQFPLPA
jgi:DNA-binding Lrp family transcriptional regulator